jgi:hypothetical protein
VTKLDLKNELKQFYKPSAKEFSVVNVPNMNFLMIDGRGNPNTAAEFQDAVSTLYAVAYAVKFAAKKQLGSDYTVMPLEGLWWADDMSRFSPDRKEEWLWTVMIMQPDLVTADLVSATVAEVRAKKDPPALPKMRFEPYEEGLSVQILHIGSFATEGPVISRMHEHIAANGYEPQGKHHEIYLSNPERTAPEKLRTVLRQPVRRL